MANGKKVTLDRLDQKLDDLIKAIDELKLDNRIASLERWRTGVATAVSALYAVLVLVMSGRWIGFK